MYNYIYMSLWSPFFVVALFIKNANRFFRILKTVYFQKHQKCFSNYQSNKNQCLLTRNLLHKWDRSCKWKNWRNEQQCEWKLTLQLWWWLRSYIWKPESWMYAEWYLEWRTSSLCGYLLTVNQLLFACEVCKVRGGFFPVVNISHIVTIHNTSSSKHVL